MFPLLNDDTLAKVTRYELTRSGQGLTIEVHWYLHGPEAGKFTACPFSHRDGFHVHPDLWGNDTTELAALRDCLEKIKHLSPREVLARL